MFPLDFWNIFRKKKWILEYTNILWKQNLKPARGEQISHFVGGEDECHLSYSTFVVSCRIFERNSLCDSFLLLMVGLSLTLHLFMMIYPRTIIITILLPRRTLSPLPARVSQTQSFRTRPCALTWIRGTSDTRGVRVPGWLVGNRSHVLCRGTSGVG